MYEPAYVKPLFVSCRQKLLLRAKAGYVNLITLVTRGRQSKHSDRFYHEITENAALGFNLSDTCWV